MLDYEVLIPLAHNEITTEFESKHLETFIVILMTFLLHILKMSVLNRLEMKKLVLYHS